MYWLRVTHYWYSIVLETVVFVSSSDPDNLVALHHDFGVVIGLCKYFINSNSLLLVMRWAVAPDRGSLVMATYVAVHLQYQVCA